MELRETSPVLRDATLPVMLGGLVLAMLAAPVVSLAPALSVVSLAAVMIFALVVARPVTAAYVIIGVAPLLIGIDRGSVIPVLRANEALALLVAAALLTRGIFTFAAGRPLRLHVPRIDLSLLALAVTGSVLPLLWMFARGKAIEQDDLLYAIAFWKYYVLFLVVRAAVRRTDDVSRCLWLSLATGSVIALLGILQAVNLFGVAVLLDRVYEPALGESFNRATSTLGQSLGLGDFMIFQLAIVAALLVRTRSSRALLVPAGVLFLLGALASGQFSAFIALVAGVLAFGLLVGRLGRTLLAFLPLTALGALAVRPVIERRLNDFDNEEGVPVSWSGRMSNLQDYIWPELMSDYNWLLGVRTAARVIDSSAYYGIVFIESGHTWLLWTGGIPLFAAFFVFLWVAMRMVARVARERSDGVGSAAIAAFVALTVVSVGMIFDPHLTLRGSADLLFPLLALACAPVAVARSRRPRLRET